MHATSRQLVLWLLLSVCAAAAQQVDDPANLMGERVSPPALADTLPINHGAAALEQLLRKLRTRASMMLIVAHPDDEDGGLLTYESRGMGARVAMLTLTRGEGGQNLMSADFNDALGLIRTQELLAEDRYTGVDQMFGTEVDFGFSKTKEETLKKWGHDRVLYDAVRAVRLYRPLVLASVFVGGVTDGHGHHQVAGEICQEVFLAAADPKVFPEMGLPPWAPLRVYTRVPFARVTDQGMFDYATGRWSPPKFHNYVTGEDITHEPGATVTIHEGDKPKIPSFEGDSYVQFARRGLALQKSQIGANFRVPPAGAFDVGYTLMASRVRCTAKAGAPCLDSETWASAKPTAGAVADAHEDLFTGVDTSLPTIADLAPSAPASLRTALVAIDGQFAEAQKSLDPAHPELTAPALRDGLRLMDSLIRDAESSPMLLTERFSLLHELKVKRVQCNDALVLALGISFRARYKVPSGTPADRDFVVSGGENNRYTHSFEVALTLSSAQPRQSWQGEFGVAGQFQARETHPLGGHETFRVSAETLNRFGVTRPYFSRPNIEQPYYNVGRPQLRNAPEKPPLAVTAELEDAGVRLDLVRYVETEHGPLSVVPPLSIDLVPAIEVEPVTEKKYPLTVYVENNSDEPVAAPLRITKPEQWISDPLAFGLGLDGSGKKARASFVLKPKGIQPNHKYFIGTDISDPNGVWGESFRSVGYPGLTYTNYFKTWPSSVVAVDVTTAPNLHIAYLPGTGDEVPQFLPSLGVTPTILAPKDLTPENLKQYDAIILGVRAYAAHPELSGAGSKPLNDYAAQGGVVVVQYNSGGFDPASAPFPYMLPGDSAHNVVEEDQPVTLLRPDAPLLTWPNRITSADFNGWIEERGHGFASEWAKEYEPLLETNDVDQDPQKGGLLVAKVGKGVYIYCALALYRQLPEGVPGAYRLFANLLSYAKNPKRE
jgi:LmbE family N-acetylglucosaminyl deacetylase